MMPSDPIVWMLVFARVSAMLAIFPVFSSNFMPVQLRIALGALLACFTAAALPPERFKASLNMSRSNASTRACMVPPLPAGDRPGISRVGGKL